MQQKSIFGQMGHILCTQRRGGRYLILHMGGRSLKMILIGHPH